MEKKSDLLYTGCSDAAEYKWFRSYGYCVRRKRGECVDDYEHLSAISRSVLTFAGAGVEMK
jgi:hypothetical protein